jgi:hypothetical protein
MPLSVLLLGLFVLLVVTMVPLQFLCLLLLMPVLRCPLVLLLLFQLVLMLLPLVPLLLLLPLFFKRVPYPRHIPLPSVSLPPLFLRNLVVARVWRFRLAKIFPTYPLVVFLWDLLHPLS